MFILFETNVRKYITPDDAKLKLGMWVDTQKVGHIQPSNPHIPHVTAACIISLLC